MLPSSALVCDIGSGRRRIGPGVITVDLLSHHTVDVQANILRLPFADATFDAVFCVGMLEHVLDPRAAVTELGRILKPGGLIHLAAPFIQGFHPDPQDYWRFTVEGLRLLGSEFEELDRGSAIGPSCGLVWIARQWAVTGVTQRWLSNLLLLVACLVTLPLKYCDYLLLRRPLSHWAASAVYFRGRKPSVIAPVRRQS
jgi:ubiquinone/menaquinone biosynthesis C-methylase UbiE